MNLFDFDRADLMTMPIPDLSILRASRKTWDVQIDTDHHRHNEALVDIREYKLAGENYYGAMNNPPVPHAIKKILVRKSVITCLLLAQFHLDRLCHGEKGLFLKDGWRPINLQRDRYEHCLEKIGTAHPGLSTEELKDFIRGQFTEVREGEALLKAPPPHCTGGAVDIILRYTGSGNFINMGEKGKGFSNPDYYERKEEEKDLSLDEKITQRNRRFLYWLMQGVGFAPSPTEYWHYSLGDQMWAEYFGRDSAMYGLINV